MADIKGEWLYIAERKGKGKIVETVDAVIDAVHSIIIMMMPVSVRP